MPIYMDIHEVPGAEALDLAEAHRKDMLIQDAYRCKCMTYWLDEPRGVAFCLIEAPDKSVVEAMHRQSHGFIPNKIIEVKNEVVASFLGRIHDPDDAEISDGGLKIFQDPAFRILLVTEMADIVMLKHKLGLEKANNLLNKLTGLIRREISIHTGREVEHPGIGFIVSFTSASKAISCAMSIYKNISGAERESSGFKMAVHAGNPVAKSDKVFGDTIQLARGLCSVNEGENKIIVSSLVKELFGNDPFQKERKILTSLSAQDEIFLLSLFGKLEVKGLDPDFTITGFCQSMSMSKSQLYRKTISLWNVSPNQLLKEFRLNKALELLRRQSVNISQATFDSGFNSPSYFTKCFKKQFGLLPAAYLNSRL
jgi:AraC-like DNA-binding protein